MGECGCGVSNPGLKFPGPDGTWYILEFYGGCRDCEAPAGVVVRHHKTQESIEDFDVENHPELVWIRQCEDYAESPIAVVDQTKLRELIKAAFVDGLADRRQDEPLDDIFVDSVLEESFDRECDDHCWQMFRKLQNELETEAAASLGVLP